LNGANWFNYHNYSVPTDRAFYGLGPYQLREQLRRQIRPVDVVVILGGMYAAHSDWIGFEIDFAKEINKPILGVRPRAAQRMPLRVVLAADRVVNWSTSSIVAGIRELRR
jgi:ABC-type amino acid transport substrate-binding protein